MTGLSAHRFGLTGRGILRAGGYADVTVFDPEIVADRATFEVPTTPAAGIEHVFVNGRRCGAKASRPANVRAARCAGNRCRARRGACRRGDRYIFPASREIRKTINGVLSEHVSSKPKRLRREVARSAEGTPSATRRTPILGA